MQEWDLSYLRPGLQPCRKTLIVRRHFSRLSRYENAADLLPLLLPVLSVHHESLHHAFVRTSIRSRHPPTEFIFAIFGQKSLVKALNQLSSSKQKN